MNARILCVALPVALLWVCLQPAWAQDAAADQAKTLLKQGLDQYKALDFVSAKATLLKVDASALSEADKKALEDPLSTVDAAIQKQASAREAYNNAAKALKDNDLEKAKEGFAAAAACDLLPAAERKDAQAELAQVDKKIQAAAPAVATDASAATVKAPENLPATVEVPPLTAPDAAPPVAVVPEQATTATTDAQRAAKSKQLVVQGKAAMEKNQPDVAANYFEQAIALDPADKDAQQLLDQARSMVATQAVPADSPLVRLEQQRQVVREAKLLEFTRGMQRSREILNSADTGPAFDAAADAARGSRKEIDDSRTYFTDKDYRDRLAEADEQIRFVAMRKDTWERQRAARQMNEADELARKRLLAQEEQRRARVATLTSRAKSLEEQKRYAEALEVLDQVIVIAPQDSYVLGWRDSMQRMDLLRQEGATYREMGVELMKQAGETREMEIPWYKYMNYPKDWRELTIRRVDSAAAAASETEADRVARQRLHTRIPKLDFTNLEFKDVIEFFRTASNANFHVNWAALIAAGVDKSTQVNLNLNEVTVEKALQLVLQDLSTNTKLSYIIDDGVVKISTKDDLAKTPQVRVYDIRDLIIRVPNFAGPIFDMSNVSGQSGANGTNGGTSGGGGGGGGVFGCSSSGGTGGCNCGLEGNLVTRQEMVTQITDMIKATIDKDSWTPTGTIGSISELSGALIVTQTAENHQQLVSLIEQLRETRTLQVAIEARFISVSTGFLNSIGVDLDVFFNLGSRLGGGNPGGFAPPGGGNGFIFDPWTGARVPTMGTSGWGSGKPGTDRVTPLGMVTSGGSNAIGFGNMIGQSTLVPNSIGSQVSAPAMSIGGTFLDDIQVDFLVQATQANSSSRTLTAPRVTLFNGQRAYVTVTTNQAYIQSFQPITTVITLPNGGVVTSTQLVPVPGWVPQGATLDVEATVSADRRYVTMTVQPQVITNNGITSISVGFGATLQLPNVTVQMVKTTVNVPDGGTLLLGGQKLAAEVEREGGVPILSKIPVINRFFTNRGKIRDEQTLLILIKPKIIIPREEEERNFPPIK